MRHAFVEDRHPLTLSTREFARFAVQVIARFQHPGDRLHLGGALFLGDAPPAQWESDIGRHGHVQVQRAVLEHHGDVPISGVDVVELSVAQPNFAFGDDFESREHAEQCGFVAPDEPTSTMDSPSSIARSEGWTACVPLTYVFPAPMNSTPAISVLLIESSFPSTP